jgi:hypothetical protein
MPLASMPDAAIFHAGVPLAVFIPLHLTSFAQLFNAMQAVSGLVSTTFDTDHKGSVRAGAVKLRATACRRAASGLCRRRAGKASVPSNQPCQPHRRRERLHCFGRVVIPGLPERGHDAGTIDQLRPQHGPWHPTTRTLDWSTYPLKPHQVAASALTPDRSTTPAEQMSRERKGRQTPAVTEAPN